MRYKKWSGQFNLIILLFASSEQDYLDVTSQDEIAKILLEQKKKVLMAKYAL